MGDWRFRMKWKKKHYYERKCPEDILNGILNDNDYVVIYIHVYICYSRVMLPYSLNEQRINTCSPRLPLGVTTQLLWRQCCVYLGSGLQRLKFKMEINVEQLTKVVQKNFILLTTEVEIKELLDKLYEQSLFVYLWLWIVAF